MPETKEWQKLIEEAEKERPTPLVTKTYLGAKWPSFSKPVKLATADGEIYVVKAQQRNREDIRRSIITEQVVGVLAKDMMAPVPEVTLIEVPEELVKAEKDIQHILPGIAHGSRWIDNCTHNMGVSYIDESRGRFAELAILFGWLQAGNHQYLYKKQEPRLVFSTDHGHFLPGGPNWTVQTLSQGSEPQPDSNLVSQCGLTTDELNKGAQGLEKVDDGSIANAVATPPGDWGITMEDRIALATYLSDRREKLLTALKASQEGSSNG